MANTIPTTCGDQYQRALERGISEGLRAYEVKGTGGCDWVVTSHEHPDACYEVRIGLEAIEHTERSKCQARGLCDHVALVAWRCGRLERLQQVMELEPDEATRREERDTSVLVTAGPRGRSSLFGANR